VLIFILVLRQFAVNVPEHAQEVTDQPNEHHQLYNFLQIWNHKYHHDIVIIQITIVREFGIFLNQFL